MNIEKNTKATVFKQLKSGEKFTTRVISTYEGKDQNDKAIYSQWVAKFVGKALPLAKKLDEKDHILINSAKVENIYNSESKTSSAYVTIFDFTLDTGKENA